MNEDCLNCYFRSVVIENWELKEKFYHLWKYFEIFKKEITNLEAEKSVQNKVIKLKKITGIWEVTPSAYDCKSIIVPMFFSKQKILNVSEVEQYFNDTLETWIISELRLPPRKKSKIRVTVEILE